MEVVQSFNATECEKSLLGEIINEWNARKYTSSLFVKWMKEKPPMNDPNLTFLNYNVNSLKSHITDLDIILNKYAPQICILTEIGMPAIRRMPIIPNYQVVFQEGSNAFGGVAIAIQDSTKYKVMAKEVNFLLIEVETAPESTLIGAVYVPPGKIPPFHLFEKCKGKPFCIFGDFNAKHQEWECATRNESGDRLMEWLEATGNEVIIPPQATSRRSDTRIDFGITHDASGWSTEVAEEGTSDHFPCIVQSPLCVSKSNFFRVTYWNVFSFFLKISYNHWLSLVYNYDEQFFFSHFSEFIRCLWDRCSVYKPVCQFRPLWPPSLVSLAREVNRRRRIYRRNKTSINLDIFLRVRRFFLEERSKVIEYKHEKNIEWIASKQNIWKFARPIFKSFSPPFKGLTVNSKRIIDPKEIVETLANHYEEHFAEPKPDVNNPFHQKVLSIYESISLMPNIPLEKISINEVMKEWKKFAPKKSTDSMETSALLLKKLPDEYLNILTILFNKCAEKGDFFSKAKHAKMICIPKEGLYPPPNRLRPISLLPNVGKCLERVVHSRILNWCKRRNIFIDEQSGFTPSRRLQTRVVSLVEDLKLTIAANNRPALLVFIDFLSAFDRMWYPALIASLWELEMPIDLLKWIFNWLQERSFCVHYGSERSREIPMAVGAPQGSVIAATLFRLHIHFLCKYIEGELFHLFADDLVLIFPGSLEKKFSINIPELEARAAGGMSQLEKFSEDYLLPVNVAKTKAMLVHSVVSPLYPKVLLQSQPIDFVMKFKYLGVILTTKLGWGLYIRDRLRTIRKIYGAMKCMFRSIGRKDVKIRRRIFLAYALPHFLWLACTWFHYTNNQKELIEHTYCAGLRIVYNLDQWDDYTTLVIAREKSLKDYLFSYWRKFMSHLLSAEEGITYQQSWNAYLTITSPDKSWLKSMGLRSNSKFSCRLIRRVHHSIIDWIEFDQAHVKQFCCFSRSPEISQFVYKYFLSNHPLMPP